MPFWLTGGVSGVRWAGFQVPGDVCPAWLHWAVYAQVHLDTRTLFLTFLFSETLFFFFFLFPQPLQLLDN